MTHLQVWDHHFDDPKAHLDFEETLLDHCESTGQAHIRFWESPSYFVVLGRSNNPETEVNEAYCAEHNIPVLRRCSGGGTVLQGPGCLNIALILPISADSHLKSISSTTSWIMQQHADVLNKLLGEVTIKGVSDLVWKDKKCSGNAQRRKLKSILFHGTFLYDFDVSKVPLTLQMPSKAPDYRENRDHLSFVTNIPLSQETLKSELLKQWKKILGKKLI